MSLLDSFFGFPTITHVQREYNWEILLPSFGLVVDGYAISKYCQQVKFGPYDISDFVDLKKTALHEYFPGNMKIDDVSMSFVVPVPDIVSVYFYQWKRKIISSKGFYYPSSNYKKYVYIILYDRSGIPSNVMMLKGVFPVKFPSFPLLYSGEKELKYDIVFKADDIELNPISALGTFGKEVSDMLSGSVGKVFA
jgi:hypothetical protein